MVWLSGAQRHLNCCRLRRTKLTLTAALDLLAAGVLSWLRCNNIVAAPSHAAETSRVTAAACSVHLCSLYSCNRDLVRALRVATPKV